VDRLSHLVTGLLTRARVRGGTQEIERNPWSCTVTWNCWHRLSATLTDNALRHGGGDVELSMSAGLVSVVDSGPGLGQARPATGHGIGLAAPGRSDRGRRDRRAPAPRFVMRRPCEAGLLARIIIHKGP
jgi:hypothetical protein